ncbi:hypothetical protein, partial [Methylobacillus flagellatus]|uniref:hypothetical protein n=1 Tax=Methylobacillus flagellatus TaxID=405 RepID=UPI002868BDA1
CYLSPWREVRRFPFPWEAGFCPAPGSSELDFKPQCAADELDFDLEPFRELHRVSPPPDCRAKATR